LVSRVFPHAPPSDRVHILVVTEERTFIFVDVIVTYLTCALVLEGLEDVGDLKAEALKSTPALSVSTALQWLIMIMTRQNAKRASNHSGARS
jgi:hypothetical protein